MRFILFGSIAPAKNYGVSNLAQLMGEFLRESTTIYREERLGKYLTSIATIGLASAFAVCQSSLGCKNLGGGHGAPDDIPNVIGIAALV